MKFAISYILIILLMLGSKYSKGEVTTLIRGKVTQLKLREATLSKYDYVTQKDSIYYKTSINNDSTFVIKLKLNDPSYFRLINSTVWITPGDTINLVSDGFTSILEAEGNNKGNYLLMSKIHSSINSIFLNEYYRNNLDEYLKNLKTEFDIKLKFYNSIKISFSTTPDFEYFVVKELKFEYLSRCLMICFITTMNNSNNLLSKYQILNEIEFNDEAFITNTYGGFLYSYFLYLVGNNIDANIDSEKKLRQSFDIIDKMFNNRSAEALRIMILRDYALNDFSKYDTLLNNLISMSSKKTTNQQYLSELIKIHDLVNICNRSLTKDALNSLLFNIDSSKITLSDILSKYKDKVVVIDFWATWCAPCVEEIPYIKKLYTNMDTSKIVLIFLSRDRKIQTWKEYLIKEKMNFDNHYFLSDNNSHPFVYSLSAQSIPRYVILNKNKNLAYFRAPRPSEGEKLLSLLKKIIEN